MLIAAAAVATSAFAEGYQVNTLSAKQNGMGHTGTALKLGAESQIFNPAGMGWMDHKVEVEGSFSPIFSHVTATMADGSKYETDSKAATPISFNAAFSIYDNLKAGVSFYTPYGSCINWTDNWPGAVFNQSVNLKMFTIQPTVAWRPVKNLSIGAGLMISWGNVDLNQGLVTPESFATLVQRMAMAGMLSTDAAAEMTAVTAAGITPASINLTGSAHPRFGINVGVMYDINDQWTVGASFRSEMMMKVKAGTATLNCASEQIANVLEQKNIGLLNQAQFKAQMPCAAIFNMGVSYRPINPLTLAFDAQFTKWNAYRQLDIEFDGLADFNQEIPKNYRNSWTFHLGAQYELTRRFDVRAGLMIDTTPVRNDHYNPETPGMTKIEPSLGFSFRPVKSLSIDFSMLYVAGLGADNRSVSKKDMLAESINTLGAAINAFMPAANLQNVPENYTFRADYKLYAICPSIGLTYSF